MDNKKRWGERRYYSLDYELKNTFGEKVYKITLNGGMTCPNRDGRCGTGGCIFCSAKGSGDFAGSAALPIEAQLARGKKDLAQKRPIRSYIAYFQAFTNTYAPVDYLEDIFSRAIRDPDVKVLSVATRPDCLGKDVLNLLERLNRIKPVWVELGLQTIHPRTADYIRRGYPLEVFDKAVSDLRAAGIRIIVHVILFLPGETEEMMMETIDYLNRTDIQGIKLQLLHILQGTDLALDYEKAPFYVEWLNVIGIVFMPVSMITGWVSILIFKQGWIAPYPVDMIHILIFSAVYFVVSAISFSFTKKRKNDDV